MQRKFLIGGALTLTLGLVGAPWIQGVFGSSDSSSSSEPIVLDESMLPGFDLSSPIPFGGEPATSLAATPASNPASLANTDPDENGEAPEEMDELLTAIEGLKQDFRGEGMPDFSALDRQLTEREDSVPEFDREALLSRFPLTSLVIGPDRTFAQLGGELVTAGSVLSDGYTRIHRITAKGVELAHGNESIWMPLPPVRHVPATNSAAGLQPGTSAESFPDDSAGMNDSQAFPGP